MSETLTQPVEGTTAEAAGPDPTPATPQPDTPAMQTSTVEEVVETVDTLPDDPDPHAALKARLQEFKAQRGGGDSPEPGPVTEEAEMVGEDPGPDPEALPDNSQPVDPKAPADQATPDAEEYAQARAALKRVLKDDALLDSLPRDAVLERGKVLQKRESDQQAVFNENQRLRAEIDKSVDQRVSEQLARLGVVPGQGQPPDATADTPQPAEAAAHAVDPSARVREAVEKAFESSDSYLDDDFKGVLNQVLDAVVTPLHQDLARSHAEVQQAHAALQALQNDRLRESDQAHLRQAATSSDILREFPELSQDEKFEAVRDKAYQLAQSDPERQVYYDPDGSPRWQDLIRHAAHITLGPRDPVKQTQAQIAARQRVNRSNPSSRAAPSATADKPDPESLSEDQRRGGMIDVLRKMKAGQIGSP